MAKRRKGPHKKHAKKEHATHGQSWHERHATRTPSVVSTKYAGATFFDPATRSIRHANGTPVTATPERANIPEVGATGSENAPPLAYLDRLYVCEQGDHKTIAALAKLANLSIAALEDRRCAWRSDKTCSAVRPDDRRRCLGCPYADDDDLPF